MARFGIGWSRVVPAAAAAAVALPLAYAAGTEIGGAFGFDPIDGSVAVGSRPADAPFKLPAGFTQSVLWDERGLFSSGPNYYATQADVPDMIQTNETGTKRGRYLYRTMEVRSPLDLDGDGVREGPWGSVTVTDLETRASKVLVRRADWEALDGLKWTPWGTLLFAEEVVTSAFPDPDFPSARSGLLYEATLDPHDPSVATAVAARPAVGALAHEGIGIDSAGNVYVVDEFLAGSIYKFVPDRRGDLSSGQLHVLEVLGFDFDDYSSADPDATVDARAGAARWVPLDRTQSAIDARVDARAKNGTPWFRPEDLEIVDNVAYVAITGENLVLSVDLKGPNPVVAVFVKAGRNVPVESSGVTGLENPDNIAIDRAGNVYIVEDNSPGDIWCATPDRDFDGLADNVVLFASLAAPGAEPTGLYFGIDPATAFVHVQHSSGADDMTVVIKRPAPK